MEQTAVSKELKDFEGTATEIMRTPEYDDDGEPEGLTFGAPEKQHEEPSNNRYSSYHEDEFEDEQEA